MESTSLPLEYRIPDGFMVEASEQTYDRLMLGMMGGSMAWPYKKVAQMYMGSYAAAWFGEPPEERPWVVHDTNLEDTDEIRMAGFVNLACGNEPLYATANRLYFKVGSGSAEPAQEVFAFMKRVEKIHKDSVPVPYVTIVPTWESLQAWRTKRQSWNWSLMSQAFGLVMLDERISVDVNPSTEMSKEWLEQQRVIALCGASGISDAEAKRLGAWVEQGGGLLATYDTGLYNEKGELRRDGGALKEVLGVEMKGDLALWVLGNVGFKDADVGLMRQEYVPVSDVEVSIRVPEGRRAKGVRLMRADRPVSFRLEGGYAVVMLPSLHIAEVVHLELG